MKKAILIFALLAGALTIQAQNVTTDANGNYVAIKHTGSDSSHTTATQTGKTFTDNKGKAFPVFVSAKGKLFVNKISKSGNSYKMYLKVN